MKRTHLAIAMDRSTRTIDQDGHLRVLDNIVTAAGISPYLGSEIPDADRLGLDPDRVYRLLRPADELERAASTLAGKPLSCLSLINGHQPLLDLSNYGRVAH